MGRKSMVLLICLIVFIVSLAVGKGAVNGVFVDGIFPQHHRAVGRALGSSAHWVCAGGPASSRLPWPMFLLLYVSRVALGEDDGARKQRHPTGRNREKSWDHLRLDADAREHPDRIAIEAGGARSVCAVPWRHSGRSTWQAIRESLGTSCVHAL